ncbi:MAG TPA: alpha/beta hydrolase [Bacteroidetes bacterium]|nr:alpha/beta hydrolase [Bacteroidota bacterium]
MKKINYLGKEIAYYESEEGEGLPIVLLHGFCEDSRMWDEWLPKLPSYRTYLLVDLPGFGDSEMLEETSMENMAGAVAAVLEECGIKKCVLVGHSMGGYVGLEFAKKYSEKLAGLCLFHSHPFADAEEKKEARLKAVDFINKNGHILYVRQMIPKLFAYDYSKGYQSEVNRLIYFASKYKPEAIIAALRAMRLRPDNSEVLKNIKCPVQFIIGKDDSAIPYELSMAQAHLPNIADIQILPNVGHMGMFKEPRKTAKKFKEFLKLVIGD